MEGFGAVGADGGGCAVGVQGDVPAPAVDRDKVVEPAEQREVGEGVPAAVFPVHEVVDVAAGGGGVAAGEPAVLVPQADCAAEVDGDGVEGAGDVERQADGGAAGPESLRRSRAACPAGPDSSAMAWLRMPSGSSAAAAVRSGGSPAGGR